MNPMTQQALNIEISGIPVRLWSGRALDWPEGRTLFVADTHFGKAASFRSLGIAAPDSTRSDLDRIDRLVMTSGARRLVVLGDFFHAHVGVTPSITSALAEWRSRQAGLEVVLVRGNHDLGAGDPPRNLGVRCFPDPWRLGPWVCRHEPAESPLGPVLAGHLHPGRRLRDRNGAALRVACFSVADRLTILPAFGSFTGAKDLPRRPGERLFAVSEQSLIEVS